MSEEDYLEHTIYFMAYSLGNYDEFVFNIIMSILYGMGSSAALSFELIRD